MRKGYLLITVMVLMVSMLLAGTVQALTVSELMQSTEEKMVAVTGYEMKSKLDLVMSAADEKLDLSMVLKGKFRLDPLCVKMQTTIALFGEKEKMDMYMQVEDGELAVYVVAGKEVIRSTMPLSDDVLSQMTGASSPDQYLDSYKKAEHTGNGKVNGKNVYIVTLLLDAEAMEAQFEGEMAGMLISDQRSIKKILSSMEDMPVTLYIDQKTHYIVRMEMDMTNLMNKILKAVGGELNGIQVDKYSAVFDYSNMNKVKPFSIPSSIIKKAVTE